jgi:hypothetical protein
MNGHGIPIGWRRGAACGVKSGASGLRRFDRQGAMEATRNGACRLLHLSTLARRASSVGGVSLAETNQDPARWVQLAVDPPVSDSKSLTSAETREAVPRHEG